MRETKRKPIYDAKELTTAQILIFAIQHMFAMFGATILVPIITGLSVQVTLFCAGVGTLGFHIITRGKVPAFLGSSFAFLGGFAAISALDTGVYEGLTSAEKLPYACGGIVVAGVLYIIMAGLVKLVGVRRVMRFLPPVVTGPIIICIGLSLLPSAAANIGMQPVLAIIALAVVIYFNIWGKGMAQIIPILLGVVISYIAAILMQAVGITNTDGSQIIETATIGASAMVGMPPFVMAKFEPTAIGVMAPIAIATMMEHVGDIVAIGATTDRDYIEDPGLHMTLVGDGLMTSAAGFVGGPANTTYGENTGVLALTKVFVTRVMQITAVIVIALSFSPKLSAVIGTMPTAIIGGISFVLYGMISAIGVRNVVENQVDLTKPRNLIIVALIMGCGLGFSNGVTIPGTSIVLTSLALAAIVGIIANAVLPGKDYEFGVSREGDMNRGLAFGEKPEGNYDDKQKD